MTAREISDELFELIRPYYRGGSSQIPVFKKTLNSNEVQNLLTGLHGLCRRLMNEPQAKGA